MKNLIDRIKFELCCIASDIELMKLAQSFLETNLWDERIGFRKDLDDFCDGLPPIQIIQKLDENFNIHDRYITMDEFGIIYSYDVLYDAIDDLIDIDELVQSIIDDGTSEIPSIQALLNERDGD